MDSYSQAAMERAMKVQEVILRAMAKKITWWQAAEIIGISDRSMRRWRERYEEHGYDGLLTGGGGSRRRKRVWLATVEQVLGLYREHYFDLNVRHFHEKLVAEHGIELSYTWVKPALQEAGLVKRGRIFSPNLLGSFTFGVSYLHGTAERNGYHGFALAFPFSSTAKTISGFETYGDNQFVTPITAFPVVCNQEKYQFRHDVSGSVGRHAPKFGVDFIHEQVLNGAFPGQAETLYVLTEDPTYYLTNPAQFTAELNCLPPFDGSNDNRAVINGVQTTLDQFRGAIHSSRSATSTVLGTISRSL